MSSNILITGAAGYIGGSIITDSNIGTPDLKIEKERIIAAVRTEEQAAAISATGIKAIQLDLTDPEAVSKSVLDNDVGIIIHTASSINPELAINLVNALGKRKEASGEDASFVHTSGLSAFYPKTGWPADETRDLGPVFETEKRLADSFPIRETDVAVIERSKALGVTSYIVVPSAVYGKGSGAWNRLSVIYPQYVKTSLDAKKVYKFTEDLKVSHVHISDLTALYGIIVKSIVDKKAIPSGEEGYYFALAHDAHWWEVLERMARRMKARELFTDSNVETWPSIEFAAEKLGVPAMFVEILFNSGGDMTSERPYQYGWKPKWDEKRFLDNIDDEIDAVLELGKAKSSLMDSLKEAGKK